jgi:PD-(D/E)XK endonuclease
MKYWERFRNYKERGEWVELQFMAQAAKRRFSVCTPWGETRPYDIGIEYGPNFLRVQVKSTIRRKGAGYYCEVKPNHEKKQDYTLEQIDLFAAYVIPEDAWYLIPAALLLGTRRKTAVTICPIKPPVKKASYCYEPYRDAWALLTKTRTNLAAYRR